MSLSRALAVSIAVTAALLVRSIALAEEVRVVLIGPSPRDATLTRMRDELAVLGFSVEVTADPHDGRDLPTFARSRGATAAAWIRGSPPEVVLWVDPALSADGSLSDELRVASPAPAAEGSEPGLLALRAVELLHGKLLHAKRDRARAAGQTPPSRSPADAGPTHPPTPSASAGAKLPAPQPPAPAPRAFALMVGQAFLVSPGGLAPMPHVRVGAEVDPVPRVGVEVMAFLPIAPATVRAPGGAVDVRVLELGGGVRGLLTDPAADLSVSVGLGLGAMLVLFEGDAAAPYVGVSGSRWVAAPYLEAAAAYRLYRGLGLRLDLVSTIVRPEPIVRIAERDVASFGQPAVFVSLAVEVRP